MKIAIKYLLICFLFVITSCSNNEDSQPEVVNYFNRASCNGVEVIPGQEHKYRFDDIVTIDLTSYVPSTSWVVDTAIKIKFNLNGHFGQILVQRGLTLYENFAYDSATNFHFELEEYNQVNNTIKGNYSGKVYQNPEDLNSDFVTVEGSFFFKLPQDDGHVFSDIKLKMNGTDWKSTVLLDPTAFPYEGTHTGILNQFLSDDKFKFVIGLTDATINAVGNHLFDDSSTDYFVKLGKFNPVTNQFDYYISSQGGLNITTAGHLPPSGIGYFYTGSFSFTATNTVAPFDVITITDGIIYYHD